MFAGIYLGFEFAVRDLVMTCIANLFLKTGPVNHQRLDGILVHPAWNCHVRLGDYLNLKTTQFPNQDSNYFFIVAGE